MSEAIISLVDAASVASMFGVRDQHLRRLHDAFGVVITHRDGEIHVAGEDASVARAADVLGKLRSVVERKGTVSSDDVTELLALVASNGESTPVAPFDIMNALRRIAPRTPGQVKYVESLRKYDLVFANGPSGTGKTYLAVASAVEALKQQTIRKIVLVRPAVEAGESLGYLPGDLQAKINPYLRPLLDALHEMIDHDQIRRLMDEDVVEVIPLAYMRGRTLNDAFIILDEAQNTTVSQMKMFLTRMGQGSRIVVGGDTTQVDLPPHTRSGLTDAITRLKDIKGFNLVLLGKRDIVRHRLVQDIVQAYEQGPRKRKG